MCVQRLHETEKDGGKEFDVLSARCPYTYIHIYIHINVRVYIHMHVQIHYI